MTSMENGSGSNGFNRLSSRKKKEIIMRGVLSVTVISGEDLPAMDMNGKSDPYVVLSLKKSKTKYKTRVIYSSYMDKLLVTNNHYILLTVISITLYLT